MRTIILLGTAAMALSGCQMDQPPPQPRTASAIMPSGDALEGADDPLGFTQAACGGCHAVERYTDSPNPMAPPFASIANREGLTDDSLSAWLRDAHNYPEVMDFDLTPDQAELVAEYMLTLRSDDYSPPI